jgi:4-hydroxythreonine-4-phosphate dehydrogenase
MTIDVPVLAITPGEPSGIGPEILLKLNQEHPEFRLLAVADPVLLQQAADMLGSDSRITQWQPGEIVSAGQLACFPMRLAEPANPGQLTKENAPYVLDTLRQAVRLIRQGHAAALVTGPVHKGIINEAGVPFTGHTEFLANLGNTPQVVMMLTAPGIRVALVTTHLPLLEVPAAITTEKLKTVIQITETSLQRQFGITRPRLQVLGLNPHAGEGGHLGEEDEQIIRPVIEQLRQQGMDIEGPVPADTAFTPPRIAACDVVVAMYHDQGLPVLKHLGFGQAVNITLGLPFIRTSVDHGTALDIAGTGQANANSLYQAALCAQQMSRLVRVNPS